MAELPTLAERREEEKDHRKKSFHKNVGTDYHPLQMPGDAPVPMVVLLNQDHQPSKWTS